MTRDQKDGLFVIIFVIMLAVVCMTVKHEPKLEDKHKQMHLM